MYLSFKPTKNQIFRLYFDFIGNTVSATNHAYVAFYAIPPTIQISKDGGGFINTTNAPVSITTGRGYVDLTATEMNADVILIATSAYNGSNDSAAGACVCIEIYTTTGSGGSGITAQDVWEYATRGLTSSVTVTGTVTTDNTTLLATIKKYFLEFMK